MKAICKKTFGGFANKHPFLFTEGTEYEVFTNENGEDYLINNGCRFFFRHSDQKFLKCFNIIEDELTTDDMKALLEIMNGLFSNKEDVIDGE